MDFQNRLRRNFLTFSIMLIVIVCIVFISIPLIISYINESIDKRDSINSLDKTFQELTAKIIKQMEFHNDNYDYLSLIEDHIIKRQDVAEINYNFARNTSLAYNYNIYSPNLEPIYEEEKFSQPREKLYLSIIKERIENNDPLKFIMYCDQIKKESKLVFYKGLYKDEKFIGIDIFLCDINSLSYFLLPNTGNFIVTNKFGTIIASNNYAFLSGEFDFEYKKTYSLNGIDHEVTKLERDYYNIYYLEEKTKTENYYSLVVVIFILLIVVLIILSDNVIKKIAKRNSQSIESIIKDVNIVSSGKLDHKINDNLEGEFENLAQNINHLIDKLNSEIDLNKELSDINLIFEKKKLDSQFNPHFLYNSLETIRYSMMFDVKETEKYILELNSMLRYSINNNITYSTLYDDMKYIKKYLEIYKFRFKDKLTYELHVDPEVASIKVPKLSIQPLVGNSIKYGFRYSSKLHIKITANIVDNYCYIRVFDTGVSLDDKVIKEINDSCKNEKNITNHIGVHNVLRRFKIIYNDSELKITKQNDGTVFEIRFKKETKYV